MALASVALVAIGTFALYLVAANILIRTRMLRNLINEGPDRTWIDYESATTWWPGLVRVRGLRIRDRDSVSEWMITLDEGRASISLVDLLQRRFHPAWIRGGGFSLRVRSRLLPEEATPSHLEFIPPILGFPDPPMRNPAETPPVRTGREWTIWLEDVVVGADEIWVDDWTYEGEAEVRGSMLLHPRLRLEVFPSSLNVLDGILRLRGKPVVASTAGRLEALIHPCDLRAVHGNDVFRFLTGNGRVRGNLESVNFLEDLLDTRPRIRVRGGAGDASAEATIDRGGGHGSIDFSAQGIEVRTPDQAMEGEARGRIRLLRMDLLGGTADFSGSFVDVGHVVVRKGDQAPRPWSGRLALASATVRGPGRLILSTHVEANASDARPLFSLLNLELPRWAGWVLSMEGLAAAADVTLGPSLVDVKSLDATGEGARIHGRYHRKGTSVTAVCLVEAGPFAVGVSLSEGKTRLMWIGGRRWFRKEQAGNRAP